MWRTLSAWRPQDAGWRWPSIPGTVYIQQSWSAVLAQAVGGQTDACAAFVVIPASRWRLYVPCLCCRKTMPLDKLIAYHVQVGQPGRASPNSHSLAGDRERWQCSGRPYDSAVQPQSAPLIVLASQALGVHCQYPKTGCPSCAPLPHTCT